MMKKEVIVKNVKEIKSVLAKLLATENLSVEFANVETASFDVEKRILRIPTMKEIDPDNFRLVCWSRSFSCSIYTNVWFR